MLFGKKACTTPVEYVTVSQESFFDTLLTWCIPPVIFFEESGMRTFFLLVVALLFSINVYADPSDPGSTISVFVGQAVSNSVSDEKSRAWGIEQETRTRDTGTWLFGYLNEGHQLGDKRDGIYAQLKIPHALTHRMETSIAVGPYYTATTITEPDGVHYRDSYCTSLLASASIKYALGEHWSTQFRWSHVMFAPENKDADVFVWAIGYYPVW